MGVKLKEHAGVEKKHDLTRSLTSTSSEFTTVLYIAQVAHNKSLRCFVNLNECFLTGEWGRMKPSYMCKQISSHTSSAAVKSPTRKQKHLMSTRRTSVVNQTVKNEDLDTFLLYTTQLASYTGSVSTFSYLVLSWTVDKAASASSHISQIPSFHNLLPGTTTTKCSAQAEIKSYDNKTCKWESPRKAFNMCPNLNEH